MKLLLSALAAATAFALSAPAGAASGKVDLATVKDHPLVSRFAGSKVTGIATVDFDAIELPLGPTRSGAEGFEKQQHAEGRITRIAYEGPAGKSGLEVYRNFRDALEKAGFKFEFECSAETCGDGYTAAERIFKAAPELKGNQPAMIDTLLATNGDVRILTAQLDRPEQPVALTLLVSKDSDHPVGSLVDIVEGKAMAQGQVKVDAKAMGDGLASAGHIALYGIQFETDSAKLVPASDDTLAQMAALLKSKPDLKVYIVGHTDSTGSLAHNLQLSQQRADAVVKALVTRQGVNASRLAAKGVASFAPVASNASEAGRAQNRRVELVAQ